MKCIKITIYLIFKQIKTILNTYFLVFSTNKKQPLAHIYKDEAHIQGVALKRKTSTNKMSFKQDIHLVMLTNALLIIVVKSIQIYNKKGFRVFAKISSL